MTKTPTKTLFPFVSHIITMVFTVMVMIFLTVSWTGTKGLTIIYWDAFGEHTIETILFVGAFIVSIVGFYVHYKRYKAEIKK